MPVKISRNELDEIEASTLAHYENNAESFWQGTRNHDISENIDAFLDALPKDKTLDILDFGCGPGRDICTFQSLGHKPVGLDGCEAFCQKTQEMSGCPALHQQFLKLELKENKFDGIFANASLFHVPSQELPGVLSTLYRTLRPGGILFTSNPRGSAEGWQGQRYGHYMEFETSKAYLENAGFKIVHHYYRPSGQPRALQPWLAIICQSRRTTADESLQT